MSERSHVDIEKINKVPSGHPFEYKDVVSDSVPVDEHTIDGRRFKNEVESGIYDSVAIYKDTGNRLVYKKL